MNLSHVKSFISSLSISSSQSNEYILKKVIQIFLGDQNTDYRDQFIMNQINSKDIEKLLTLLENKESTIRKLALLVLCFLLQNGKSKVYFLEKCGLGLRLGKIFLTRLKYLTLNVKNQDVSIEILSRIMKQSRKQHDKDSMFWYVGLMDSNKIIVNFDDIDFEYFHLRHIKLNYNDDIDTDNIPDPIYNLCGIDFDITDVKAANLTTDSLNVYRNQNNPINLNFSKVTKTSYISELQEKKRNNISRRNRVDRSEDDKSQRSHTNTSLYSAINRSHLSPFKANNKVKNKKLYTGVKQTYVPQKSHRKSDIAEKYNTNRRHCKLNRQQGCLGDKEAEVARRV